MPELRTAPALGAVLARGLNISGVDATATFRGLDGIGAVQGSGAFNINNFTPDTSLGTTFKDMNVNGQFATPDHGTHTTTITGGIAPDNINIDTATQTGAFSRMDK